MKNKDENAYAKQPNRKPLPVVPVAQFEAFKVYEDKPEVKKLDAKKSAKDVAEKQDVFEKEESKESVLSPMSLSGGSEIIEASPMSVDKSLTICTNLNKSLRVKPEREIFYDMPEYRIDIHKYLREAEVRSY